MILHQRATPRTGVRSRSRQLCPGGVPILPVTVGLVAAFIIAACNDGPTSPAAGSLKVTITTTGGDLDENGYELIAAERTRFVAPQSFVSLDGVEPGAHMLELKGVADNCGVVGDNPRSVTVERGHQALADIEVRCDRTGVLVETVTTGSDYPALGYAAVVGIRSVYVGPNESAIISRLPASSHTVSLSRVADNCSVADDSARTVVVEHRKLTRVAFAIMCTATEARVALVIDSLESRAFHSWVAIADADGRGIATPLSRGHSPAWSPDGTKLLYSNSTCDFYYLSGCTGGLVVRDAATGTERILVAGHAGRDPAWSPDGRYIAFVQDSLAPDNAKLHVMNSDGTNLRLFAPGLIDASGPSWSPDGERLVFQCRVAVNDVDLCVINSDGTGFLRLRTNPTSASNPEWSPDGSRIAFTTLRTFVFPTGEQTYFRAIGLIAPDGTGYTLLSDDGWDPSWSPDGSKLVIARSGGLFTVNADGTGAARITTGSHRAPRWRR